jgi:hypothetical protein
LQYKFFGTRFQRSLTRRTGLKLAVSAVFGRCVGLGQQALATPQVADLPRSIPQRAPQALTGSQFAESVASVERPQREHAILGQLLSGNLPSFLRKLSPVKLSCALGSGKILSATIFVMPEYLAIGSDDDFLRIPMNLHTATAAANHFGCVLPTKKVVDSIYAQSSCRFTPQPLPAGPQMTSTGYYRLHNGMIEKQSQNRGFQVGALVSGHKKDVVLTNRLNRMPDRIAIYGWHRDNGEPIQPLSTVHGANYADYSHGIRLVSAAVVVEGQVRHIHEVLQDPVLAKLVSDEGPIHVPSALGSA